MDAQTDVLGIQAVVFVAQTVVLFFTWRSISTNTVETGKLCAETAKLREATEQSRNEAAKLAREAVKQTRFQLRPIVLPEWEVDGKAGLSLRNCGLGCALNVEIAPIATSQLPGIGMNVIATFNLQRDFLAGGERTNILPQGTVDGKHTSRPESYRWFHPTNPGPQCTIEITFADIEGNTYRSRTHVAEGGLREVQGLSGPWLICRKVTIDPIQQLSQTCSPFD